MRKLRTSNFKGCKMKNELLRSLRFPRRIIFNVPFPTFSVHVHADISETDF